MNDFSSKTIKALNRKGIRLMSLQSIPDMSSALPFASASRGYVMDDNGCCKVWTFAQVLEAAK